MGSESLILRATEIRSIGSESLILRATEIKKSVIKNNLGLYVYEDEASGEQNHRFLGK
jgi:hypothetical protein